MKDPRYHPPIKADADKIDGPQSAGARIIEGLKEAMDGDFASVTIDGVEWVRADEIERLKRIESAVMPVVMTVMGTEDPKQWLHALGEMITAVGEIQTNEQRAGHADYT